MADTNDTIDGLLAEFRGYSAGMPPSYHVTMSWADFRFWAQMPYVEKEGGAE